MNSEISQTYPQTRGIIVPARKEIAMKKKLSAAFLVLLLCLSFTACSSEDVPEWVGSEKGSLDVYWVAGKNVKATGSTVQDFPITFPELYRDFYDPDDLSHNVITRTISVQSGNLFYKADITPSGKDGDTYMQATVGSLAMFRGKPGNMRAWGVTFEMSQEEAEKAILEYVGRETSNYDGDINDLLTKKEQEQLGYIGLPVNVRRYGTAGNNEVAGCTLNVAYLNDQVVGLRLEVSKNS